MRLTTDNYLELLRLRNTHRRLWPDGILHYTVSDGDSSKVASALGKLQSATGNCVRFVRRSGQSAYVDVIKDGGCWSYIGRRGRRQALSLGSSGCYSERVIQHEFLHALGFYHEQSRSDRDEHIVIHWKNIRSRSCKNFFKKGSIPSGFPGYDTKSIMHYRTTSAACRSGRKTMTTRSGGDVGGRRLSSTDVRKIKALYKCR